MEEDERIRFDLGDYCLCGCGKVVVNRWQRCKESRLKRCPYPHCTNKIEPASRTCDKHHYWGGEHLGRG